MISIFFFSHFFSARFLSADRIVNCCKMRRHFCGYTVCTSDICFNNMRYGTFCDTMATLPPCHKLRLKIFHINLRAEEFRINILRSFPLMESCSKYFTGAELKQNNEIQKLNIAVMHFN